MIDNAETMDEIVQNKLLKAVEESNSTIYVFVTTMPLLPTIHSRCFDIPFFPLEDADLQKYLELKGEKAEMPLCAYGGSIGMYENMKGDDSECSTVLKNFIYTLEKLQQKKDILDVFQQWDDKEAGKFCERLKPHLSLFITFIKEVFAEFYLYLVSGKENTMLNYEHMEQVYTISDAERIYKRAKEESMRVKTYTFSKNDFFMLIANMAL